MDKTSTTRTLLSLVLLTATAFAVEPPPLTSARVIQYGKPVALKAHGINNLMMTTEATGDGLFGRGTIVFIVPVGHRKGELRANYIIAGHGDVVFDIDTTYIYNNQPFVIVTVTIPQFTGSFDGFIVFLFRDPTQSLDYQYQSKTYYLNVTQDTPFSPIIP